MDREDEPAPLAQLSAVRAELEQLVDILVARGVLNEGHRKILRKVGEIARPRPPVRLALLEDKYQVAGPDIDCASLMHLCRGRCCTFKFALSEQDLDEGTVKWSLDDPYVIRQGSEGYCVHNDPHTRFCGIYEHRPATCRRFDCREDRRIWVDFEKRIPAA